MREAARRSAEPYCRGGCAAGVGRAGPRQDYTGSTIYGPLRERLDGALSCGLGGAAGRAATCGVRLPGHVRRWRTAASSMVRPEIRQHQRRLERCGDRRGVGRAGRRDRRERRVSKVIRNGTIVTADRTWKADVLVEGETIKAIGRGPEGRRGDRRHRRLRDPGRDRPAHPSRDAVHGDDGGGDLRERHLRGGLGRDDDAGRLRAAGPGRESCSTALDDVGPQVEAADLRRYRLPHGDHRLERADLARDGRGGEARGQHLQALHGLQGRADGRGRRDVRVVQALRRARGAAAGACRERRHRRGAAEEVHGRGADRARGARLLAAAARSRARRRTGRS